MTPFEQGFVSICLKHGLTKEATDSLFKVAVNAMDILIPVGSGIGGGALNYFENKNPLRAGLSGLGTTLGAATGAILGRNTGSPDLKRPTLPEIYDPRSPKYVAPPDPSSDLARMYQQKLEEALQKHTQQLQQYDKDIASGSGGNLLGAATGGSLGGLGGYYLGDWVAQQFENDKKGLRENNAKQK